jgi:hypothetical protein
VEEGRATGTPFDRQLAVEDIPGLPALIEQTTPKELVAFCRANVPAAMKRVVEIMKGPGYKPDHSLKAIEIVLERAFGRAPVFVKLAGDDATPARRVERSGEQEQAFAKEVLSTLVAAGVVKLPEGATLKRDDEEVVDAEVVRHVEFPEVVNPARPLSRDALLKSANIEPIVAPPPTPPPAPSHFKAGDESDGRCESLIISAATIDADPSMWRAKMRPMLQRYAERCPEAGDRVDAAIAIMDQRFGA